MGLSVVLKMVVFGVIVLLLLGIPQDAVRAWRGTHAGDRLRLFKYYRTAYYEGVPVALERYGVPPDSP